MAEKTDSTQFQNHILDAEYMEGSATPQVIQYEEEPATAYTVGWRTWLAVLALSLGTASAVVSQTTNTTIKWQVATVGDPELSSWIANGNLLVALALGPIVGSLSDRLGKKWFIICGCLLGIIGACTSATAHRIGQIIGGGILNGIANACCMISMAANQEIVPNKYRPIATGIGQTVGFVFSIFGTFVAGAVVKYDVGGHGGWRWAYYVNAIMYGLACLSVLSTYFPPPPVMRRQESLRSIFARVDYGGVLLLCSSLASLIVGITWGGATYSWSSKQVVATLTCGCVGLILFGLYEWLFEKRGIFDHRLMQSRNFPILLCVCLVDGMMLLGVNPVLAQEIAQLFTQDAVKIALILLPYLLVSAFGAFPAGWLMAKTKSYQVLLVAALMWCALFVGLMGLVNQDRLAMVCVFSALFGAATAVTTVIPMTTIALSIPSFLMGTASTLGTSARALGGVLGFTIFTAVYNNKIDRYVVQDVGTVVRSLGYNATVVEEVLAAVTGPDPAALGRLNLPKSAVAAVLTALSDAQSESWTYVWIAIACVVAVNAILACLLQPVAPRMNAHIESALEKSEVRAAQFESQK